RLRASRRERFARAIHAGNVLPGNPMWTGRRVEVRELGPKGRPSHVPIWTGSEMEQYISTHGVTSVELYEYLGKRRSWYSNLKNGFKKILKPTHILIVEAVESIIADRLLGMCDDVGTNVPQKSLFKIVS